MQAIPVIAVFDVGKTNKKVFLFDQAYKIVYEGSVCLAETVDEDGDPCESLESLQSFVFASLQKVFQNKAFHLEAVNFSTYGASFVHLNEKGSPATPLYNYLKPYPEDLLRQFYDTYGGEHLFSVATASPVMGHLNSGMQLYWLKHTKPQLFKKITCSLHLPQYLSFLLTGKYFSDITSIGCHTNLWDFEKQQYHNWVFREGIAPKLAPIVPSTHVVYSSVRNGQYSVGAGLHDSSAALIPYLSLFHEPFVLISTGTWCISVNPFTQTPLTYAELQQDCLCYLTYEGKPIKASRLFAGNEHEQQVKRLSAHFNKSLEHYKSVYLNVDLLQQLVVEPIEQKNKGGTMITQKESPFTNRNLTAFTSYEEAYHQLIMDIIAQQIASTQVVLNGAKVKHIFVDGGFSKNPIYMHLLAAAFSKVKVFATSMAQATAMGAALAIHSSWNTRPLPRDIIELKCHSDP